MQMEKPLSRSMFFQLETSIYSEFPSRVGLPDGIP